jgi:hypothetical protein
MLYDFHASELSGTVTFAGPVDTPQEVLRGADILLFTSTAFEGLARVCLEALLMELPVVATRCLGPEEYLLHGETALLADPGDADTLASHIETLLDNPGYGEELAKNGNSLVKSRYDENRVNAQWMALYDELDAAGRTQPASHASTEIAINLVSLCGQLGEQIGQQEKRLRDLERLARFIERPARVGKQLLKKSAVLSERGKHDHNNRNTQAGLLVNAGTFPHLAQAQITRIEAAFAWALGG